MATLRRTSVPAPRPGPAGRPLKLLLLTLSIEERVRRYPNIKMAAAIAATRLTPTKPQLF